MSNPEQRKGASKPFQRKMEKLENSQTATTTTKPGWIMAAGVGITGQENFQIENQIS